MIISDRKSFDSYIDQKRNDLSTAVHDLWTSRDESVWAQESYFYTRLGELADKVGQAMFAYDVLEEGLKHFPRDLRLIQLYCLSLIKCGYLIKARDLLSRLVKQGHQDEETLGILGRVYKEMWSISSGGAPDHPSLRKSRNLYLWVRLSFSWASRIRRRSTTAWPGRSQGRTIQASPVPGVS
jgi:hypothetical protein